MNPEEKKTGRSRIIGQAKKLDVLIPIHPHGFFFRVLSFAKGIYNVIGFYV